MGKDFDSWVCQWHPGGQFSNAKSSSKLPFDIGKQNTGIPCAVPSNCPITSMGFSGLPNFTQGVIPNSTFHEKLFAKSNLPGKIPGIVDESCMEVNCLMTKNFRAPKQFLVFDQSGNKTTMMFTSGAGNPIQLFNSLSPKATTGYCNSIGDEIGLVGLGSSGNYYYSGLNMTDDMDEGGDMHEDTDEINALLYSDDDDNYSEDGETEETSTGHSPVFEKQDWLEDDMDETASSCGPAKRKKLCDGSYEAPSVKPKKSFEFTDDAESSCAGSKFPVRNGGKRSRKEKIRETVKVLQTVIPGAKGKDAVMVIDDAIEYLRALRFKAESLGLSAL